MNNEMKVRLHKWNNSQMLRTIKLQNLPASGWSLKHHHIRAKPDPERQAPERHNFSHLWILTLKH